MILPKFVPNDALGLSLPLQAVQYTGFTMILSGMLVMHHLDQIITLIKQQHQHDKSSGKTPYTYKCITLPVLPVAVLLLIRDPLTDVTVIMYCCPGSRSWKLISFTCLGTDLFSAWPPVWDSDIMYRSTSPCPGVQFTLRLLLWPSLLIWIFFTLLGTEINRKHTTFKTLQDNYTQKKEVRYPQATVRCTCSAFDKLRTEVWPTVGGHHNFVESSRSEWREQVSVGAAG